VCVASSTYMYPASKPLPATASGPASWLSSSLRWLLSRAYMNNEHASPRGAGEEVEDCGHWLPLEQTELVNAKMIQFLRSVEDERR
jgi:pimeloyl-ACP methyl ester carboxylesterase